MFKIILFFILLLGLSPRGNSQSTVGNQYLQLNESSRSINRNTVKRRAGLHDNKDTVCRKLLPWLVYKTRARVNGDTTTVFRRDSVYCYVRTWVTDSTFTYPKPATLYD